MKEEKLLKKVKKFGFTPTLTGDMMFIELQLWLMKEGMIEVNLCKSVISFNKTNNGTLHGEYFYLVHVYYDQKLEDYNTFYSENKKKKNKTSYSSYIEQLKEGIIHAIKILKSHYESLVELKKEKSDSIVLHYVKEAEKRCIPPNNKTTLEIINESIKNNKKKKLDKS